MKTPRPKSLPVKAGIAGLRQKTLFRIAAAYAVSAWLVIQVAATVAPAFGFSGWFLRGVILLAVSGFVATVAFFGFVRLAGRADFAAAQARLNAIVARERRETLAISVAR